MSLEVYRRSGHNNSYEMIKYLNIINQKLSKLEDDIEAIKDTLRSDIANTC